MSGEGRAIEIHGATPAGAACAAVLNRAAIPVRIIDAGARTAGLAVVSRQLPGELRLDGSRLGVPVEKIVDRRLTEDDALDTAREPGSVSLVQMANIVDELAGQIARGTKSEAATRMLSVDAGEFRLGNPDLLEGEILPIEKTLQCLLLGWDNVGNDRVSWTRMTGETLSDVNATASILTAHNQTTMIFAVPMASVIETSIAVVDVLARLLAHPAVKDELPGTEPRSASTRLIRTGEPTHVTLHDGFKIRIGAAAGLAQPVVLDRELRSGIVAAEQIGHAITDGRLSLARLSRIARVWSTSESALEPSA
jgi:flavin-dependent dehydrogenase